MLPVRYDWIFSRHCATSVALSPVRRVSQADRPRPLTGVPVFVSVTLNLMLTSSPAFTFAPEGSAANSIAIPCSTIFCCANEAMGFKARSERIVSLIRVFMFKLQLLTGLQDYQD